MATLFKAGIFNQSYERSGLYIFFHADVRTMHFIFWGKVDLNWGHNGVNTRRAVHTAVEQSETSAFVPGLIPGPPLAQFEP